MKIEAGKYYKTRDGDKVGPMIRFPDADWSGRAPHWSTDDRGEFWGRDGTNGKPDGGLAGNDRNLDLIAEWTDGPVRTVTRREVVYGTHANVIVEPGYSNRIGVSMLRASMTASELKAAAAVLLELAGALE